MKRIILCLALVVAVCTGASAESSVWKAQKGHSVIYLGGTCHLLREADYPLPPEFEQAYQASASVVFETDIGKLQDPATQKKLLAQGVYADGSTIEQHLSAQAYGELSAYCASNNVPLKSLRHLKPALLMTTLTVLELSKLGVTQHGVDEFFYELAHKDKKAVDGLETADEQISYVASMADGNEDEFVAYSLKDMQTLQQQFDSLAQAWRKGDMKQLDKLMVAELKTEDPQLYKKLITDRNRNWLPVIEAYQQMPQTRFVLVGVGHLVGPDGIIAALKKKGYKVTKL